PALLGRERLRPRQAALEERALAEHPARRAVGPEGRVRHAAAAQRIGALKAARAGADDADRVLDGRVRLGGRSGRRLVARGRWPCERSRAVARCWQPGGPERTIHAMATGPLPRGTLTFLFTDIEGSTKLLNGLGTDRYHEVLETHTDTLRQAFTSGHEVRIE